jgi:hypothetical protein
MLPVTFFEIGFAMRDPRFGWLARRRRFLNRCIVVKYL